MSQNAKIAFPRWARSIFFYASHRGPGWHFRNLRHLCSESAILKQGVLLQRGCKNEKSRSHAGREAQKNRLATQRQNQILHFCNTSRARAPKKRRTSTGGGEGCIYIRSNDKGCISNYITNWQKNVGFCGVLHGWVWRLPGHKARAPQEIRNSGILEFRNSGIRQILFGIHEFCRNNTV